MSWGKLEMRPTWMSTGESNPDGYVSRRDPRIPKSTNPIKCSNIGAGLVESLLDLKAGGCLLLKHPTYI
jgi:hypothetical protein